jgi:hypothetical protein
VRPFDGARWRVNFANAFARMVKGAYSFPRAPGELEQLIRSLARDEITLFHASVKPERPQDVENARDDPELPPDAARAADGPTSASWTLLNPAYGWQTSPANPIRARLVGGHVFLEGDLWPRWKISPPPTMTVLPLGLRPARRVEDKFDPPRRWEVETDGRIVYRP